MQIPQSASLAGEAAIQLGQHRIMGQGDSARDFDTSESMKNAGILDVFPIFHTARLGQKIRRSLQLPLCGVALDWRVKSGEWRLRESTVSVFLMQNSTDR